MRCRSTIASLIALILLLNVGDGGYYRHQDRYSVGRERGSYSHRREYSVGQNEKKDNNAKDKKLYVQQDGMDGTIDQHKQIYQMKRIRCDWDGDGQLNRPNWAGSMQTQTTGRKAALASNGGDKGNTQIMAQAIIIPMHVPCRPEPKKPWNGFATGGNTDFTRGRIIPFELGGINSRANIVPVRKGWDVDGGGWQKVTSSILGYVKEIYGWERLPKDYEVYELNIKGDRYWESSKEFETPDIMMQMIVDLNPDWSDGYNRNNNLDDNGVPRAFEIRLIPDPKKGNECLVRRIDIQVGENPSYFAWDGTAWETLNDLGDPYVNNIKKAVKQAKDEEELAEMIAKGMKANGFLNKYSGVGRRHLADKEGQGTGKFCGQGGKRCECDPKIKGPNGKNNRACDAIDTDGYHYCYVSPGVCKDGQPSTKMKEWHYSRLACEPPKKKEKAKPKAGEKSEKDPNKRCMCDNTKDASGHGGSDCKTVMSGVPWCYTKQDACKDGKRSKSLTTHDWSKEACAYSKPAKAMMMKKMQTIACKCADVTDHSNNGGSDCKSVWEEKPWCYARKGSCKDGKKSKAMKAYETSHDACIPAKVLSAAKTTCRCDGSRDRSGEGGKDCKSVWEEKEWCFTAKGACMDGKPSTTNPGKEVSNLACMYHDARIALKPSTTTITTTITTTKAQVEDAGVAGSSSSPDKRGKQPKKIKGEDDDCFCDGVVDHDGNGGDDCLSEFDQKPWCYVKSDSCSDGKHSKTLKSHDWSFVACTGSSKGGDNGKKELMLSLPVATIGSIPYIALMLLVLLILLILIMWRSNIREDPTRKALLTSF